MRLAGFRERNKDRAEKNEVEEDTVNSETLEKNVASSEGIPFKMAFAGFRERNKDRTVKNTTTTINGNENGKTHFDGPNPEEREKEGRSFKDLMHFGGVVKPNSGKENITKKGLAFPSLRGIGKKDDNTSPDSERSLSEGQEPTASTKKNFGFRSVLKPEATGKKKIFEFRKMNLPKLSKQPKFPMKDSLGSEPAVSAISKFTRNPFAKKVANSDKDLERAISAALEGEEKLSEPKPAPLREKFVGLKKSASQSMKVAAQSTPQIKRPIIAFNKLGSVNKSGAPRPAVTSEEELITFEDLGE